MPSVEREISNNPQFQLFGTYQESGGGQNVQQTAIEGARLINKTNVSNPPGLRIRVYITGAGGRAFSAIAEPGQQATITGANVPMAPGNPAGIGYEEA